MNTNTVTFIHATDLIPESWNDWFWSDLSDSSNITFGDNDYSLINAERFQDEFDKILDFVDHVNSDEVELIRGKIAGLKMQNVYISL